MMSELFCVEDYTDLGIFRLVLQQATLAECEAFIGSMQQRYPQRNYRILDAHTSQGSKVVKDFCGNAA